MYLLCWNASRVSHRVLTGARRRHVCEHPSSPHGHALAEAAVAEAAVAEAAVAEAAEEADDVPLQPSPFVDSALADEYEKLNYAETLFAKQQLVAVYVDPPPPPAGQQPEAKQWLLGHISAVNVRGKINGANEQAIWYRLGAPRDKRRKEFILCPTDGKQERHGIVGRRRRTAPAAVRR